MNVAGVDPGLGGACAIVTAEGVLVALHDTPVLTLKVARGTKQTYDIPGMCALLQPYAGAGLHVVIEESQAMPGQGVRSTWTTGFGYGLWIGALTAFHMPYTPVRPVVWKKALALGKDKEQARLRAMQLYPGADLRLRKHHGRAESLLLARYGLQHLTGDAGREHRCVVCP